MQYSTDNLQISLTLLLASRLREKDYNVRWQLSGEVESFTSGAASAKGTVTLVKESPANPEHIVRLNDGESPADYEIPIPALTLQVGPDHRGNRYGMGHSEFFRTRTITIDGLARDEFEQADLERVLSDWLLDEMPRLSVSDYADPNSPVALNPIEIRSSRVVKTELSTELDALRYYVRAEVEVEYVE